MKTLSTSFSIIAIIVVLAILSGDAWAQVQGNSTSEKAGGRGVSPDQMAGHTSLEAKEGKKFTAKATGIAGGVKSQIPGMDSPGSPGSEPDQVPGFESPSKKGKAASIHAPPGTNPNAGPGDPSHSIPQGGKGVSGSNSGVKGKSNLAGGPQRGNLVGGNPGAGSGPSGQPTAPPTEGGGDGSGTEQEMNPMIIDPPPAPWPAGDTIAGGGTANKEQGMNPMIVDPPPLSYRKPFSKGVNSRLPVLPDKQRPDQKGGAWNIPEPPKSDVNPWEGDSGGGRSSGSEGTEDLDPYSSPPLAAAPQPPASFSNPTHIGAVSVSGGYTTPIENVDRIGTILFSIDMGKATRDANLQGIEFDGSHWWVTGAADYSKAYLYKVSTDGALVARFLQPQLNWGTDGWRDMAFDGQFLYAGDAQNAPWKITQIDPATGRPTGKFINSPVHVAQALAYDPVNDSFWVSSGFSELFHVARKDGELIGTYRNELGEIRGLAIEVSSQNGHILWIYCQEGATQTRVARLNLDADRGEFSKGFALEYGVAGGAAVVNDYPGTGKWILAVLHKGEAQEVLGFELAEADGTITIEDKSKGIRGSLGIPAFKIVPPQAGSHQGAVEITSSSMQPETGLILVGFGEGAVDLAVPVVLQPGVNQIPVNFVEAMEATGWSDTYWQVVQTDPAGRIGVTGAPLAKSHVVRLALGGSGD